MQEGLDQAKNPFIADASAHPAHQGRAVRSRSKHAAISVPAGPTRSPSGRGGGCPRWRPGARRPGRNPYDEELKPGSKIGSSTSFSAAWTTRSLAVGMPRRRSFPLVLGTRALAYGQRDEGPVLQVGAYSGQEPDHAACGRLDPRGGPAVDPGCSRPFVRPDPAPRHREERRIRHEVVQVIEHAARISRGLVVKLGLNTQYPPLRLLRVGPLDPTRSVGGAAHAAIPRRVSYPFPLLFSSAHCGPSPCGRRYRPRSTTTAPSHPGPLGGQRACPLRPVRRPPAEGGTRVVPMFTSFRSSREGPGYTPAVTTAPADMRRGLLPATGCRPKRGPAYRDSPARTAFPSPIHQVRDGSGQARRQTPVPHVSLRESLAGPARSGSTRTSRRCQGRLPPPRQRFPRRDGCPQLRPAAATTEPRGPLTPVRKRSASWRTSMAQWPRAQEATASGRA